MNKNAQAEQLIKRCLKEAVIGTITAEKPQSGGAAEMDGTANAGQEGESTSTKIELTVSKDAVEAVIQAITAIKTAGAPIDSATIDGEPVELVADPVEPEAGGTEGGKAPELEEPKE